MMIRIHSSQHKCLSTYYLRIMRTLYSRYRPFSNMYEHYESIQGLFYNNLHRHRIVSTNGFAVDVDRLDDDFRIVRFIRDPRDLIISGYFYHLRGAEPWFRMRSPTPEYWAAINGNIPGDMPRGVSYSEYLQSLSKEEGLVAEIQFRKFHLESLRNWPQDERIKLYRYESILGNEVQVFADIFDFYQLTRFEKLIGTRLAGHFAFNNRKDDKHIRNPSPGQWREHFTPAVIAYFDKRYRDIVDDLGYTKV